MNAAVQMPRQTSDLRGIAPNHQHRNEANYVINVGSAERLACVAGGSALVAYGLSRGNLLGLGVAAVGGTLVYRGLSGYCGLYNALGFDTSEHHGAATSVRAARGVKVVQSVIVHRMPEEVYRIWHDLEGLPHFMSHLKRVKVQGHRSHWTAKAPAGMKVEWAAEVINDEPYRLIAWRSLEGSQVSTAGSVHFNPTPDGLATEVLVTLKYDPPAGKLGSWIAWAFGDQPEEQICQDLDCFKQLMETGELQTATGAN